MIYLYLEDFQEKVLDRFAFFRSSRKLHGHEPQEPLMALAPAVPRADGERSDVR